MDHTTYVYIADDGSQVLVTLWDDGGPPEVAIRPDPGAIWSPPLELERKEGTARRFAVPFGPEDR